MSDVRPQAPPGASASVSSGANPERPQPTLWTGWILLCATLMVLLGAFQVIAGLVALLADDFYSARGRLLVDVGYTTWGWVHLAVGAVALVTGVGLMRGATWARVTGVAVALLSAVVNLAFISAYPAWAVLMIAVDVLVIYAITTHGHELRDARV
jgi:hypothetical protein